MPENVKLHPHENYNCDRDGVALPPEIVLEVKNLTKKFQVDGGKVLTACDKVNLNAYKGQTLGIIGESGCGKSTLVRTILQIHPATEGEVIFEGQNILKLEGEALRQNRRKIQMVFPHFASMILIWLAVKPATSVTMSTMRAVSASVMPPSGAATARLTLSSPMKATQSV